MASQGPFGHGHGSESAFGSESYCRLQRHWLRRVIKSDSCFQRTGHTKVDVQISWSPLLPFLAFTHLSVLSCNLSAVISICSCLWPATKAYLLAVESSEFVYKWSKLGVEIQHHHNLSSHIPLSPMPSLSPVCFTGFTLLNVWTVPAWAFDLFTLRRGPLFFLKKKTWLPRLHLNRRSLGSSSRGVKKGTNCCRSHWDVAPLTTRDRRIEPGFKHIFPEASTGSEPGTLGHLNHPEASSVWQPDESVDFLMRTERHGGRVHFLG